MNNTTVIKTANELAKYLAKTNHMLDAHAAEESRVFDSDGQPVENVRVHKQAAWAVQHSAARFGACGNLIIMYVPKTNREWVISASHPLYGWGDSKINHGLPAGVKVQDLKPGVKILVRWCDGDMKSIIIERSSATKRGSFPIYVLGANGVTNYPDSEQIIKVYGSVF